MADVTVREATADRIQRLEAAARELERAEAAVAEVGADRIRTVAEAYDAFLAFIDENDGEATGSGREAFRAYLAFQDELVARIDRLPDDLLAREAFEQVGDRLDKRRLTPDDMERARDALEPAADRVALLDARRDARRRYRRAKGAVAERLREVESAIDERTRLEAHTDADLDADLSPLRERVEAYNAAVREAFDAFKRTAAARDVLDLLETGADYPLVGLHPAPEPLARYLRADPVGEAPVARLLELADHSRSKLAHYVDDPDRFRATVAANRTYLARLDAGPLTVDWPPPEAAPFRFRARELVAVVDRFAPESTVAALHALRDLARHPEYDRLRRAAVARERLDDDERERLRSGAVADELDGLRAERERLMAALDAHAAR